MTKLIRLLASENGFCLPFCEINEPIYELDEVLKLVGTHIIKPDLQVVVIDL